MSEQAQNALLKFWRNRRKTLFLLRFLCLGPAGNRPFTLQLLALEALRRLMRMPPWSMPLWTACAPGECELLFSTAPLVRDKETLRLLLADLILLSATPASAARVGRAAFPASRSAARLASSFSRDRLMALLETAQAAVRWQSQNANAALLVTALCSKLRAAAGK
ncbi:MAG: hypothetical protein ACLSB9_13385 [Hydrogeniiclostridium mannosilyticum]